jgi:hypothetical protein
VWAEEADYELAGRLVHVRVNSLTFFPRVIALLPSAAVPAEDDVDRELVDTMISVLYGGEARDGRWPFHLAYLNHKRIARMHDASALLDALRDALDARLARWRASPT